MANLRNELEPVVLVKRYPRMMAIILNRPHEINALTTEMVRFIRHALDEVRTEDRFQFVLFLGAGSRGFCSGGDVKILAETVKERVFDRADQFFQEEYALDLYIHRFPKPVIVIADGITMGGGVGLSAGADIVVATEQTVMAMPETRIGFFPDVGATGWMFSKCPKGYPEYLGLTGYEMKGAESVSLGLANKWTKRAKLQELKRALKSYSSSLSREKKEAVKQLEPYLAPFFEKDISSHTDMDAWVAAHFSGKTSIREIMTDLFMCRKQEQLCEDAYHRLSDRSPTALALTLNLLRRNEGKSLEEVFATEAKAAHFIVRHPDYLEGIRAHILDRDHRPHWQPSLK